MTRPLIAAASLLVAAAVADVLAHTVGMPALEAPAHVATLAGMVATLAVVVIDGLAKKRHPSAHAVTRADDPCPLCVALVIDTARSSNNNENYR